MIRPGSCRVIYYFDTPALGIRHQYLDELPLESPFGFVAQTIAFCLGNSLGGLISIMFMLSLYGLSLLFLICFNINKLFGTRVSTTKKSRLLAHISKYFLTLVESITHRNTHNIFYDLLTYSL